MHKLTMVHPDVSSAPPPRAPEGIVLRTYRDGDEGAWADIVNSTDLGRRFDAAGVSEFLTGVAGLFDPEGLFFACDERTHQPLATACAWSATVAGRPRPALHMVACLPQARGRGLGRLVTAAVLGHFARLGRRQAVLLTEDHRTAAVATYLKLGFQPLRFIGGEDHAARWEAVFTALGGKHGPPRYAGSGRAVTVAVLGLARGGGLAGLIADHPAGKVLAGADRIERLRERFSRRCPEAAVFDGCDGLLACPAEAVVVANDLPDHAPAAVAAMNAGKDVLSEVTAFYTPAQGVELIETVQRTGRAYMLAENCLYSSAMLELAWLAERGRLGDLQYAEGDYVHDCRHLMRREGGRYWRSRLPPLFYSTHPLGPILRAAGVRPVRVVGMHAGARMAGTEGGIDAGAMLIQCAGGGAVRVLTALAVNRRPKSLWVCYYGLRASMETDRWGGGQVYLYEPHSTGEEGPAPYVPTGHDGREQTDRGHGGADARMIAHWLEALSGGLDMPIDAYEAADMTMPGILAHRSSLAGSAPIDLPDLRRPADRDAWRGDRFRPGGGDPAGLTSE